MSLTCSPPGRRTSTTRPRPRSRSSPDASRGQLAPPTRCPMRPSPSNPDLSRPRRALAAARTAPRATAEWPLLSAADGGAWPRLPACEPALRPLQRVSCSPCPASPPLSVGHAYRPSTPSRSVRRRLTTPPCWPMRCLAPRRPTHQQRRRSRRRSVSRRCRIARTATPRALRGPARPPLRRKRHRVTPGLGSRSAVPVLTARSSPRPESTVSARRYRRTGPTRAPDRRRRRARRVRRVR